MGVSPASLEGGAVVHLLLCAIVFPEPAVSLRDLERFPSESEVTKVLRLAEAQEKRFDKLTRGPGRLDDEKLHELEYWMRWHYQSTKPWHLLETAQGHSAASARRVVPLQHRFKALHELRKLLGPDAYRRGKMPFPPILLQ
jgi:hypothetical protein